MKKITLNRVSTLTGNFSPPPDKSISHRSIIFSSICHGKSIIKNFLNAADPLSTLQAFRALGVDIVESDKVITVNGKGLEGLKESENVIDCGNSGTTIRLLSGLLSACSFYSVLTGDESLRKRPMARVIVPLKMMGAGIYARDSDSFPPLSIKGGDVKAISYTMPVASAQVKSCLILAALFADGVTEIKEPVNSRDHSEKMLSSLGASIEVNGTLITVKGGGKLTAQEIFVPGDFSSAAFFIGAALLIKDSEIIIKDVGLNPTRTGLLSILKKMNAEIEIENMKEISGEPVGDLICRYSPQLKSIHLNREDIPSLIDEFPILCVIATQADGVTEIRGAEELRVKESDRISSVVNELRKMDVLIEEFDDGVSIKGPVQLKGNIINSHYDHRIAMAFSIAALLADGETTIDDISSVNISFPGFFDILKGLAG